MRRLTTLIVLLALFPTPAAMAEDFVVIASTDSAVVTGALVPSGRRMVVLSGADVVLVGATGHIVTVKGPFSGVLRGAEETGPARADLLQLIRALFGKSMGRETPGLARGEGIPPWLDQATRSGTDVYAIDVTSGGEACIVEGSSAQTVHDPDSTGTMTILTPDRSMGVNLDWQEGVARLPWPLALPLQDGSRYVIVEPGSPTVEAVSIHALRPDATQSDIERVALLAQHGCTVQARLLLALIAKSAR